MSPFKVTKNGPIDLIFGLWLVIMMIKNPIERILKILIFHWFLVRESLKIWSQNCQKWPKSWKFLYLLKVYRLQVQCSNKAQIVYIGSLYDCLEPHWAFFLKFWFLAKIWVVELSKCSRRGQNPQKSEIFQNLKKSHKITKNAWNELIFSK